MIYEPLFDLVAIGAKVVCGRNRAHWRVLMGAELAKKGLEGKGVMQEGAAVDHLKQTVPPGPTSNSAFLRRVMM